MRVENERQERLVEIIENSEVVLVDTNVFSLGRIEEIEWISRYRNKSDPLEYFCKKGGAMKALEFFSFEDLERIRRGYEFLRELARRNENIFTVSGAIEELEGLQFVYNKIISKITQKEERRGDGVVKERNERKLKTIQGIHKNIRKIIRTLEQRLFLEDEREAYVSLRDYFCNLDGEASEVDKALVSLAIQLARTGRDVSLISNDTDISRLLVEGCEILHRENEFTDYNNVNRTITLYSCLRIDGEYDVYGIVEAPSPHPPPSQIQDNFTLTSAVSHTLQ